MSDQKWHTVVKKHSKHVLTQQKTKVPAEGNPSSKSPIVPDRRSKQITKHQQTFETYLKTMDIPALCSRIMNVQSEYQNNPELILRKVMSIVSSEFSTVQIECDFKFEFVPSALHKDLMQCCLSVLNLCPQHLMVQCFKYYLEILLTEVKHGRPSYGPRIVLGLLSHHCEMLHKESATLASQLLMSCVNRVPEALSLLSVTLPLYTSSAAVSCWHVVCFPLLRSEGNVARDILQHVEQYSMGLLRNISNRQACELASLVTPDELLTVTISKPLSPKRNNPREKVLMGLMIEVLLPCYSEEQGLTLFRSALHTNDHSSKECATTLLVTVLELFPSCFEVWAEEFEACHSMSCALLTYLQQHKDRINSPHFPQAEFMQFLKQCCNNKDQPSKLCENLLAHVERTCDTRYGAGSSHTSPAVMLLVLVYLVLLALLLHRLALRGPEEFVSLMPAEMFERYSPHLLLLRLLDNALHPIAQLL